MAAKLGYKTFEYICDLASTAARERTEEAIAALDTEQGRHSRGPYQARKRRGLPLLGESPQGMVDDSESQQDQRHALG